MKSPLMTLLLIKTPVLKTPLITTVALSILLLSGCQKTPTPEATNTSSQNTPVTSTIHQDQPATDPNEQVTNATATTTEPLPTTAGAENTIPNPETMPLSPQQPVKGTQVTDVHYRSDSGETLSVVFQTSANGILNAIVTLPNDTKMTLSAPEGQGNNPTYRSMDADIELVSHEGGTVIDLIRNDKITSFTAISAEAEVITQT